MGYAFMSIDKVKTIAHLEGKMNHNFRLINVPNANPADKACNEEIIKMNERNYVEAYRNRIAASEYYRNRAVRKDAVKAIEVMMTYSRDDIDKVDIRAWKKANREWLIKTFGKEDVISAVYHGDESTPHIHAVVIPMVDGRLNSCHYIGGRLKLRELQSSYADAMKPFGLKRGLENSRASHKEIQKFYAEFNRENNKELPSVMIKDGRMETAEEYRSRANEIYNKANIANFREFNRMQRRINEAETLAANYRKEAAIANKAYEDLEQKMAAYEEELTRYRQLSGRFGSIEDMEKQMQTLRDLEEGQDEYKEAFPEKARMIDNMDNGIKEVLRWKRAKERRERELKDKNQMRSK